jgi:hypothetical protein
MYKFNIAEYLPASLEGKEKAFLKVLRFYWITYWPILYLFKYLYKISNLDFNKLFVPWLIFFGFSGAIIVFSIETLRVIYRENKYYYWKYSQRHRLLTGFLLSLFLVSWSYLFIITLGFRVVFYADSIFGGNLDKWWFDMIIFLVLIIGEWLFKINSKVRQNANNK